MRNLLIKVTSNERLLFPLFIFTLALIVLLGVIFSSCGLSDSSTDKQIDRAVEQRSETFERAEKLFPVPQLENFPSRQALIKFTERTDLAGHTWYVYILGDTGNIIGYYVSQTRPVNSCTFLNSTEHVRTNTKGNVVLTAPSLDGIYYGGAGSSAGCDAWFFFDAATDAMIEIRGVKFFTTDQPLALEADAINISE